MSDLNDPTTWFDGAKRVLFVHAHPDDETIWTGGTIAALAEAGLEPGVLTLTRGERGEVTAGPFSHLQGTAELTAHRENELRAALTALGVTHHFWLGTPPARAGEDTRVYEDSGMAWGEDGFATAAPDSREAALTRAPAAEVVYDVLQAAVAFGAEAIVSYDEIGGYGHPDHVLAHRVGRAVATALEISFWEVCDPDAAGAQEAGVIHTHNIAPWLDRKMMALRMHGTQLTVTGERTIVHVGGQEQEFADTESYRRLDALEA